MNNEQMCGSFSAFIPFWRDLNLDRVRIHALQGALLSLFACRAPLNTTNSRIELHAVCLAPER